MTTTNSRTSEQQGEGRDNSGRERQLLALDLPADLARALRRCTWMIIHETGRDQREIMEEMVMDFLCKHGC